MLNQKNSDQLFKMKTKVAPKVLQSQVGEIYPQVFYANNSVKHEVLLGIEGTRIHKYFHFNTRLYTLTLNGNDNISFFILNRSSN